MVTLDERKGTIRFTLRPPTDEGRVAVAGDFNNWKPVPLKKRKDGTWALTLRRKAKGFQYKFVVGDAWIVDPDSNRWAASPIGTINSVVGH